jgi:hypothetical protein
MEVGNKGGREANINLIAISYLYTGSPICLPITIKG